MLISVGFLLVFGGFLSSAQNEPRRECRDATRPAGRRYFGTVSVTRTGLPCQRWENQEPWRHPFADSGSEFNVIENYCRNPDLDTGGPWCIVDNECAYWEYCDIPLCVNECTTGMQKCDPNAVCTDTDTGFTCACQTSFTGNGQNCTALCDTNPCGNLGTCNPTNSTAGYTCTCNFGFTGNEACEDINECQIVNICPGNSSCRNTEGSFLCICNPGFQWISPSCQEIDECSGSNNCLPNTNCTNTVGSYTCQCPTGQHGDGMNVCSAQDFCAGMPCDRGTCVIQQSSFECICDSGFTGQLCEMDINECLGSPCVNGVCIDSPGSFSCTCSFGYTGSLCKTEIDACNPPPCRANERCIQEGPGRHSCVCIEGFCKDNKSRICREKFLVTLDHSAPTNVLGRTIRIVFSQNFPYGTQLYFSVFIHPNGLVYFSNQVRFYFYNRIIPHRHLQMMCPFWIFLRRAWRFFKYKAFENSAGLKSSSDVTVHESLTLLERANPSSNFDPTILFVVEWTETQSSNLFFQFRDLEGVFQCIFASDGVQAFVLYVYDPCTFRYTHDVLNALFSPFVGTISGNIITPLSLNPSLLPFQSNIGLPGVYLFSVSNPVSESRQRCRAWSQRERFVPVWQWFRSSIPCPRTSSQAFRDWRYTRTNLFSLSAVFNLDHLRNQNSLCFQRRWSFVVASGVRCCYNRLGRFLPRLSWHQRYQVDRFFFIPRFQFERYLQIEYEGELHCFTSGLWNLFRNIRPGASTHLYRPFRPVELWGDPHLATVAGDTFTFNGEGEYYLAQIPNEITIQARFTRVINTAGNLTLATAISSIAAVDHINSIVVMFNPSSVDSNEVEVTVNGDRIIFPDEGDLRSLPNVSLLYGRTSNNESEVILQQRVSLAVKARNGILVFLYFGDESFNANISGLLGMFVDRNGNALQRSDLLITDRTDFLNGTFNQSKMFTYGETWRITPAESLFVYPNGTNWTTFNPVGHVPPFLYDLVDNADSATLASALSSCNSDTSCVYDLLITQNMELAMATLSTSTLRQQADAEAENSPPEISYSGTVFGALRFEVGQISMILFIAQDADGNAITWSIEDLAGITIDETSGLLTANISRNLILAVANSSLDQLVVIANDGIIDTVVVVNTLLCDCSGNGMCLWESITTVGTTGFQVVPCQCDSDWSGQYCDEDIDACLDTPCFTDSCTDLSGSLFSCGPCPPGLTGDGANCIDINECRNSSMCTTNEMCENRPTTYLCNCLPGYQKPTGAGPRDACVNINECDSNDPGFTTFPCTNSEVCEDTDGSFNCTCPVLRTASGICNAFLLRVDVETNIRDQNLRQQRLRTDLMVNSRFGNDVVVVIFQATPSGSALSFELRFAVAVAGTLDEVLVAYRRTYFVGLRGSRRRRRQFSNVGETIPNIIFRYVSLVTPITLPLAVVCPSTILPSAELENVNVNDVSLETVCGFPFILVRLNTCNVRSVGIDPQKLVLGTVDPLNPQPPDQQCLPFTYNDTTLGLITVFAVENVAACNVVIEESGNIITYTMKIRSNEIDISANIQRYRSLGLTTSCMFNKSLELTLDDILLPEIQQVQTAVQAQVGVFSFNVQIFEDRNCSVRLDNNAVDRVAVGRPVYYKFAIDIVDTSTFVVQASSCWATPTSDPNHATRFDLIVNQCPPSPNPSMVDLVSNYQQSFVKFGFTVFSWLAMPIGSQEIYVHCLISICYTGNGTDCSGMSCSSGRKKRSLKNDAGTLIASSGPLSIITACELPNACKQKCIPTFRSYRCGCFDGYILVADQTSCQALSGSSAVVDESGKRSPALHPSQADNDGVTATKANTMLMIAAVFALIVFVAIVILKTLDFRRKTSASACSEVSPRTTNEIN